MTDQDNAVNTGAISNIYWNGRTLCLEMPIDHEYITERLEYIALWRKLDEIDGKNDDLLNEAEDLARRSELKKKYPMFTEDKYDDFADHIGYTIMCTGDQSSAEDDIISKCDIKMGEEDPYLATVAIPDCIEKELETVMSWVGHFANSSRAFGRFTVEDEAKAVQEAKDKRKKPILEIFLDERKRICVALAIAPEFIEADLEIQTLKKKANAIRQIAVEDRTEEDRDTIRQKAELQIQHPFAGLGLHKFRNTVDNILYPREKAASEIIDVYENDCTFSVARDKSAVTLRFSRKHHDKPGIIIDYLDNVMNDEKNTLTRRLDDADMEDAFERIQRAVQNGARRPA